MTEAIPEHYEVARANVVSGRWRVDFTAGEVFGVKGQAYRRRNSWGYVQIKMRVVGNWRREIAVLAHRVIWEAAHGPLPAHLQINHVNGVKTDNRLANLEVVTGAENMRHAFATGLNHAPSKSPTQRLCPADVLGVVDAIRSGEADDALAERFGVSRSCINNIRHGWTWSHVTGMSARR